MIVAMSFPHASLFPNRRNGTHWTKTKAIKTEAREDAVEATKQAMQA